MTYKYIVTIFRGKRTFKVEFESIDKFFLTNPVSSLNIADGDTSYACIREYVFNSPQEVKDSLSFPNFLWFFEITTTIHPKGLGAFFKETQALYQNVTISEANALEERPLTPDEVVPVKDEVSDITVSFKDIRDKLEEASKILDVQTPSQTSKPSQNESMKPKKSVWGRFVEYIGFSVECKSTTKIYDAVSRYEGYK